MSSKDSEIRYDFTPWDGTPGDKFDKYDTSLMNSGSRADDRGWSLSDHLLGNDEGGPTGPAMPGGAAGNKAMAAFRKRQKESYKLLTHHIVNTTIVETLQRDHFQDGLAAYTAIRASGSVPVDRLELKEKDQELDGIDIIHDIGISESTITLLEQKIRAVNAQRPLANRKTDTEMTEKFLECLFTTSKHFSEGALVEYNATAARCSKAGSS